MYCVQLQNIFQTYYTYNGNLYTFKIIQDIFSMNLYNFDVLLYIEFWRLLCCFNNNMYTYILYSMCIIIKGILVRYFSSVPIQYIMNRARILMHLKLENIRILYTHIFIQNVHLEFQNMHKKLRNMQ